MRILPLHEEVREYLRKNGLEKKFVNVSMTA